MSAILKAKYSKLQRRGRLLTFVPMIFEVVSTWDIFEYQVLIAENTKKSFKTA